VPRISFSLSLSLSLGNSSVPCDFIYSPAIVGAVHRRASSPRARASRWAAFPLSSLSIYMFSAWEELHHPLVKSSNSIKALWNPMILVDVCVPSTPLIYFAGLELPREGFTSQISHFTVIPQTRAPSARWNAQTTQICSNRSQFFLAPSCYLQ
jgi:hypothetical protein